ncbi:MAG: hypothetical protein L0H74_14860, partial [Brachybacterium sp.]|nr:hypothetical protein [Brachybacterium sp.]
ETLAAATTPRTPLAALPEPPAAPSTVSPQRIEFARRGGTQRLLAGLLLASFGGLCLTGWTAWQERTTSSLAIAAILGVLTLVMWSARSSASPPTLVVDRGQLDITGRDTHHRFDLTSDYTPIEVVGTPGRRDWKVLITRRSMPPFVIDRSMVDPHEFMEVFDRCRPERSSTDSR